MRNFWKIRQGKVQLEHTGYLFRNCKWCLANLGWCSNYCKQLNFRSNLKKWSVYLFDFHSKDENDNLSSSGTAVLPKLDTLHSLKNYVWLVYYDTFPLTLYCQVKFIKVDCTANANKATKFELKKERLSAMWERFASQKKRTSRKSKKKKQQQKKRKQWVKRRYQDMIKSIRQYSKEKCLKNWTSKVMYQKAKYRKNLELKIGYNRQLKRDIKIRAKQ